MRDWTASLLQRRTGQDVEACNRRIKAKRFRDEAALRRWLNERDVTGYAQRLLVSSHEAPALRSIQLM